LIFCFAVSVLSGKFGLPLKTETAKAVFKVPCSKNFLLALLWHYCLFVPEQNSSGSNEPLYVSLNDGDALLTLLMLTFIRIARALRSVAA
jgi:hypothetical protein